MDMQLLTIIKNLMGCIIQFTEYKYSVLLLRNDLVSDRCSLCPPALFLQALSLMENLPFVHCFA